MVPDEMARSSDERCEQVFEFEPCDSSSQEIRHYEDVNALSFFGVTQLMLIAKRQQSRNVFTNALIGRPLIPEHFMQSIEWLVDVHARTRQALKLVAFARCRSRD